MKLYGKVNNTLYRREWRGRGGRGDDWSRRERGLEDQRTGDALTGLNGGQRKKLLEETSCTALPRLRGGKFYMRIQKKHQNLFDTRREGKMRSPG